MHYLYGDSTSSPLKSNFLEFFRDAMDFSVFALQADDRIKHGKDRIAAATADAATEQNRLDRFVAGVSRAVDEGEKGSSESPASQCAARMATLIAETHRAVTADLAQRLAQAIAQIDAEEAASRAATRAALAALLTPHDIHEATAVVRHSLRAGGGYDTTLACRTAFGLEWTFDLDVPEGNAWRAPVRLDSVVQHLEIRAPQLTGWLSKEVKVRAQKLDRHVVTELVVDGKKVSFKLRAEPSVDLGFDVAVDGAKGRVKMTRVGPAEDASVGAFDTHADDVAPITALAEKLRASSAELKRGALVTATLDGADVERLPAFAELVERLVAAIAPIVCEIADRSLTPNELVLRRALANDRREEIFVPKATLREKYAVLPKALAQVFLPLGLERADRVMTTPSAAPMAEAAPVRAQLAPSQPPPAPVVSTRPGGSIPPPRTPPPRVVTARPPLESPAVPPPATPPTGASPTTAISAPSAEVTADDLVPEPTDQVPMPAPSSASSLDGLQSDGVTRNEPLVAALKKIALLTRNGRTTEAYEEYAELYASRPFSDYRPEEQREALRFMVLTKAPPARSEHVIAAHQVAILRLQTLVAALKDPLDYELLGVAYLVVDDRPAASAAFQAGLDRERERNPQSNLCGALMRRFSEI